MEYKERVENARKLREAIYAFLQTKASQDSRLEIGSKHSSTSVRFCGTLRMTIRFLSDSIVMKMPTLSMLKTTYKVLLEKHISCSMGRDEKSSYDPMTIIVDAQDAQEALSIILTYYQREASSTPEIAALPSDSVKAEEVESPTKANAKAPMENLSSHEEAFQEWHDGTSFADGEPVSSTEEILDQGLAMDTQIHSSVKKHHPSKSGKQKILLCTDVRLGAVSMERLDVNQSQKWQSARNEKYIDLIDKASQSNAAYIALWGQMFGQARVSEAVIDTLFQAIREETTITVLAFLDESEYKRISYRSDIPENLHLINLQAQDSYLDDHIALRVKNRIVELQLEDNDAIIVNQNATGHFVLNGIPENNVIPSFEPIGFEDALDTQFGYGILEWTADHVGEHKIIHNSKYAYKAAELKILPEDDEKEILRKINNLIRSLERDTFLRITLTGRSSFGLTMNSDALKRQLQNRIFFAEVYDNTVMDIDEEAFETDISLRSEFVRLALQDGSLSESERNRLISLGWSALSGREVSAE